MLSRVWLYGTCLAGLAVVGASLRPGAAAAEVDAVRTAPALPPAHAPSASTGPVTGAQLGGGGVSSFVAAPNAITSAGGATLVPGPPPPMNVIAIMLDDAGRSQFPCYDDLNRWPAGYPYPSMPFLDSIQSGEALRFTNARVNPRCAPTRAAIMTGRMGHRTSTHRNGTGVGDVPGFTPNQNPFFEGIKSTHNPWPAVARAAGTTHTMATFGKYQLFSYQNEFTVTNRRAQVDIAGYDESHEFVRSGAGAPGFGYYNYPYYFSSQDVQHDFSLGPVVGSLSSVDLYEDLVAWVDAQVALGKPFFVNWWANMPHGLLPAMAQNVGPDLGAGPTQLHFTYTFEELIPLAISPDGQVFPPGGYDRDGVFDDTSAYTAEGAVHVAWRRAVAMFECTDTLMGLLYDHVQTNHPEAFANTVWMMYSDNGAGSPELQPIYTHEFGPAGMDLGASFASVIPPTSDGTPDGTPFHRPADAKGSVKDEGILTPLLVWGEPIPASLRGTDCDRLVEATDFYNTFLDFLAPGAWQTILGQDLDSVDGLSFHANLFSGNAEGRPYSYHQIFYPGWIAAVTTEIYGYEQCVIGSPASVSAAGWKLSRIYEREYPDGAVLQPKTFELYDLNADPAELVDRYADLGIDPDVTAAVDELMPRYVEKYTLAD